MFIKCWWLSQRRYIHSSEWQLPSETQEEFDGAEKAFKRGLISHQTELESGEKEQNADMM